MVKKEPRKEVEYYDYTRPQKKATYYTLENDQYHRQNGPAIIEWRPNGMKRREEYYNNGERHRRDGPAIICYNRYGDQIYEEYWFHGKKYKREQNNEIINREKVRNELEKRL